MAVKAEKPARIASPRAETNDINVKRVYEKPAANDGFRVLVDRLWPRGLTKQAAAIDLWLKEIAPSNDLRRWYGHDPARWQEFNNRYLKELEANPETVKELKSAIKGRKSTLLYSSREPTINNAAALAEFLGEGKI